jgi:NitT/TauT family transport system ATP-binding protein
MTKRETQQAPRLSVAASADEIRAPLGPAIELSRVTHAYARADGREVRAVEDLSLSIASGEFVCVVGRSGHGKTTLLNVIAGLVRPTSGTVRVNGAEVRGPGPDRGVIFQQDAVYPWMRVLQNVEFGLRTKGVGRRARKQIAEEHLDLVDLSGLGRLWPRELSGGMRARVAVASVFAADPVILLADEPFGALDYVTRRTLQDVLLKLWELTGKTILFITHDVDEALSLASRVLVLQDGRIVEDRHLTLPRPRTEYVLASQDAVTIKHVLLTRLGLERTSDPATAAEWEDMR